ncbi:MULTISPECIES: SpvB/TcaC N-terminal domain-containing protein [unclassified Pseudomonas]|uniref:SpvB/TcaC N-terminal domain-containing protein n=1 Tax=unclassified Pseudomonas TaxID=196821 RepID=UPI001B341A5D|nr:MULTISPECIES: SpvB/TcaC N-terminal domain-containing protein [unclassified Pseudomonas]
MADQELSIITPSIASSASITTIGKSWGAVGATGAASFELPLPLSAGRGWDPQLSLTYSSQAGNGPFGVGWNLGIGQISRRTQKGVPRYSDLDEIIGDDGEVWHPELNSDGTPKSRPEDSYNAISVGAHHVVRFWPRVERDFTLRERWQPVTADGKPEGPPFWLIHGADGSLQVYGKTSASRRADPDDPLRVGSWLLCESMNPQGEHICFDYLADDQDPDPTHDYRAQRYLRAIFYGNVTASQHLYSWTVEDPAELDWHFHLLFDYGERTRSLTEAPVYGGDSLAVWDKRRDPFSTFGQGFELGTRRLCRQILMFHNFSRPAGEDPLLVRRLLLEYPSPADPWTYNRITAAHYQAFDASGALETTPPVEFDYSPFEINKTPSRMFAEDTMPGLEDGQFYQCVDLYGEGVPGFLCRYDQCWYYREPLRATSGSDAITYASWTELEQIPVARHDAAQQFLLDLTGNGRLDWIAALPGSSGYRTLNADRSWAPFIAFTGMPLEFFHTLSQLGDLGGNGLNSLAMIGPRAVRLYANQREQGFSGAEDVPRKDDEDSLPLFGNAPTELVFLGNMLGSDMSELCRIRYNEIKCWPNLGHGKFGEGRVISALPFRYDQFNAEHIRIADIDGSGAPALLCLKPSGFEIYLNRGGNGLEQTPVFVPWPEGVSYDRLCQVSFADLQGLGCASLILTVPHMNPEHWRYDFVAAKPYLLTATNNNMGCATQVVYRSSAQEWLDEKQQWLTDHPDETPVCHLPFALQVVARQRQLDEITGNCLTQSCFYREGVYDSIEREFPGFGYREQTDSESATGDDELGFTAPVRVCTWYLTGQAMDRPRHGYFDGDSGAVDLRPTVFSRYHDSDECDEPVTPDDEDVRYKIARALVGAVARIETWTATDEPANARLYAVEEFRYLVRDVRPANLREPASVLLVQTLEKISYQYDGFIDDPLCRHEVLLASSEYGHATHSLTISYARRRLPGDPPPFSDPDEQQWWRDAHDMAQRFFYLNETRARAIDLKDCQQWRLGLPSQQRSNALMLPKGDLPSGLNPQQMTWDLLKEHVRSPEWNALRVLTGQTVQRYINKEDGSLLPDGSAQFEALKGPLEMASFDKTALAAYDILPPPFDILQELANIGYTLMALLFEDTAVNADAESLWSAHYNYAKYADAKGFFRVLEYRETLSHGWTKAQYDEYHLLIISVELPDGCITRCEYDYCALAPWCIIDANENIQEALYEPSGQPLATSFHGTENGIAAGFRPLSEYLRPADPRPDAAIADPQAAVQKAASTLRKDLFSWMGQLPAAVNATPQLLEQWLASGDVLPSLHIRASARRRLAQLTSPTPAEQALRELISTVARKPVHSVALSADRYPNDPIAALVQIIISYVDGFGRALQTLQRVEPGIACAVAADGSLIVDRGQLREEHADPRWRVSARVEYNNKGLAVRQFRPFFADTHGYVNDQSLRRYGYFDQLFYDPLGRLVKLINAKGYFSRETYHPWYQASEDFNDTDESAVPESTSPWTLH